MKEILKRLVWSLLSFIIIGGIFYLVVTRLLNVDKITGASALAGILLLIMISTFTKSKQQRENELKHMSHVHDNHRPKNFE